MANPETCDLLPVPINSCTLAWTDPAATLPVGRLQGHVRVHPTGSIVETCPDDDCKSCGRGVSVCVRGESECDDLTAPPVCQDDDGADRYKNPLRRDTDGCLWVDVRRIAAGTSPEYTTKPVVAGIAPASGGHTLGSVEATYQNDTCFAMSVRMDICVASAYLGAPTGTPRITWTLAVGDTTWDVFTSGGGWETYSGQICAGVYQVASGDTLTTTTAVALRYDQDSDDDYPSSSGDVTIVYTPTLDLTAAEDC